MPKINVRKSKNEIEVNPGSNEQIANNRFKEAQSRIVLVEFNNSVDENRIVGIFKNIDLANQYNMQLWIQQHGSIIKNNAE